MGRMQKQVVHRRGSTNGQETGDKAPFSLVIRKMQIQKTKAKQNNSFLLDWQLFEFNNMQLPGGWGMTSNPACGSMTGSPTHFVEHLAIAK